jgi:DNA-binding transcriptional MerR regulator
MAERRYCKNKTPGSHPGQKWDKETKAGALMDYMYDPNVMGNICAVARRYNVPESTIRTWINKELLRKDEQKGVFAKAYEEATREVVYRAAEGARLAVTQMQQQLSCGETDEIDLPRYATVLTNIATKVPETRAKTSAALAMAKQQGEKNENGVVMLAEVMEPEVQQDGS